jgi:hypothetical protein
MHPEGHTNPKVAALIAVLEAAYHEVVAQGLDWPPSEDGYAFSLRPAWAARKGRDALFLYLEGEWLTEMRTNKAHWDAQGLTAMPLWTGLTNRQGLAICQRLHEVLLAYPEPVANYAPKPLGPPVDLPRPT